MCDARLASVALSAPVLSPRKLAIRPSFKRLGPDLANISPVLGFNSGAHRPIECSAFNMSVVRCWPKPARSRPSTGRRPNLAQHRPHCVAKPATRPLPRPAPKAQAANRCIKSTSAYIARHSSHLQGRILRKATWLREPRRPRGANTKQQSTQRRQSPRHAPRHGQRSALGKRAWNRATTPVK